MKECRGEQCGGGCALRHLSSAAKEMQKKHFQCDHQPARRDCRTCVESQGRGRPHRRIHHPQAHTLSVDLSGRLKGQDQRCQAEYFVAAVYTYPTDREGRSLLTEHHEEPIPEDGEETEVDVLEEKMMRNRFLQKKQIEKSRRWTFGKRWWTRPRMSRSPI